MKRCGKLNGYCVYQDKESCDGCQLMETWLEFKDKSVELEKQHKKEEEEFIDNMCKPRPCCAC